MTAPFVRLAPAFIAALALLACTRNEEARRDATAAARSAAATSEAPQGTPAVASSQSNPLLTRADAARITGDSTAPLWLVVVSDFQCPYCKQWEDQTGGQVMRDYVRSGKARMAFINFPLNIHPNAKPASEAAMCAAAQDKFWPMHDAIFASQERWAREKNAAPIFDSLAVGVGVDAAAYRACVQTGAVRPLVEADAERAQSAGVNSTPTFLITHAARPSDRPAVIAGAAGIAAFRATLDSVLAAGGAR